VPEGDISFASRSIRRDEAQTGANYFVVVNDQDHESQNPPGAGLL
jgi:hypothetical protein